MTERPHATTESPRATLKTLAEATGFAVATVSRALKDAPDIAEETKRRVREAAERLGYRQNRAAVRLRTGKTNVIALVLGTETDVMNFTSRLIYTIAEALRGTSYHLVVMPFFPDQDPLDPVRYLVETESADGIILNQTRPDDPRIRYMAERGFPFATHGRSDMGIDHLYYDFDNRAYGAIALRVLAARGRRHVLLVAPPREHMYARHMIEGALDDAARLGITLELPEGYTSDSGGGAIEAEVTRRMALHPRPDGFIAGSTTGAMAAVSGAERAGLRLGVDFDVAAKEAIPFLHRFRPGVIVVREDVGRAGGFLARALMEVIEGRVPAQGQGLDIPRESDFLTHI